LSRHLTDHSLERRPGHSCAGVPLRAEGKHGPGTWPLHVLVLLAYAASGFYFALVLTRKRLLH